MLVRLMYASRAVPAVDQEELIAILKKSKVNNAKSGVTGALCFSEGVFIQVLEGGRTAVSRLYNRIASDARHTDVVLLNFDEIDERRFSGWSMGQVNMQRLNPALLLKYSECAKLDPYAVSGKVSMALFEEMVATAATVEWIEPRWMMRPVRRWRATWCSACQVRRSPLRLTMCGGIWRNTTASARTACART